MTQHKHTRALLQRISSIALLGAIALALSFAVGCSGEPQSTSTSTSAADEGSAAAIDADAFDALVAAGPVADSGEVASSKWATAVKESGKLRVGGTRTDALFSLLNDVDGRTRGFDAGLYQLLARYITGDENNVDLTQVTSDTRESVLQNDQVDAVFATYSITSAREKLISFAGPYYESKQGILVKADNDDIAGVDDLSGKVVAVQSGSTGPALMEKLVPDATLQEFSTDAEARTALEQGRVDAYVIDITLHLGNIAKNPGKYKLAGDGFGDSDPYGIGLPLGSDGVAFVNGFLQQIEDDGTWAKLWKIAIGDRTDVSDVPDPPAIG